MISIPEFIQRKSLQIISAAVIVSLTGLVSTSDAASVNKRAVAVIVGNLDYKDSTPDVEYAHNDAVAMKRYITDVLNYDPDNIIYLLDATKAELESVFGNERSHEGKLWRYLDPKGRSDVTVFYSGHGVPGLKDKRGYLLPVDADPEALEINGFPLDAFMSNLNKLEAKSITVYLDTCFSGDSERGMLIRSASGLSIVPKMPKESDSRLTVITAAQGDQVASWDKKSRHGMFTEHLLSALYGEADGNEYGNGDGKVSITEVREYLDDNMTRAARRQFGRHQNAWFNTEEDKFLGNVVTTGRPRIASLSTKPAAKPKPLPVVKAKPQPAPPPKPVARLKPAPKPRPVAPKVVYRNPDDAILGRWTMSFTSDTCSLQIYDFSVRLTTGGLTSSDHDFRTFWGGLGGVPGYRTIDGSFEDSKGMASFQMEFADGRWSGEWEKKALHWDAGMDCLGTVTMRR